MTKYSEQLFERWSDLDQEPYIEVWKEGFDQPFIEYAPLSALCARLDIVDGFIRCNIGLDVGFLISHICVDQSMELRSIHSDVLAALIGQFIVLADIFAQEEIV